MFKKLGHLAAKGVMKLPVKKILVHSAHIAIENMLPRVFDHAERAVTKELKNRFDPKSFYGENDETNKKIDERIEMIAKEQIKAASKEAGKEASKETKKATGKRKK